MLLCCCTWSLCSSPPPFPQILPIRTFGAGKTASQHGYRCPSAKTLQRTLYGRIGVRHLQSTIMCILCVVSVGLDKYSPVTVTTTMYRYMFFELVSSRHSRELPPSRSQLATHFHNVHDLPPPRARRPSCGVKGDHKGNNPGRFHDRVLCVERALVPSIRSTRGNGRRFFQERVSSLFFFFSINVSCVS